MRSLSGIRRLTALAALPLALWAALPTVRWCGVGRAEVQVACFLPCIVGVGEPDGSGCEAGGACGAMADAGDASCAATEDATGCPTSDAGACDESAALPCGLTFCLDGPTGGDGVPADGRASVPEPPSVFTAILIAALAAPEAPSRWIGTPSADESPPANPSRASFHQARAPPASV